MSLYKQWTENLEAIKLAALYAPYFMNPSGLPSLKE